MDQRFRSKKWDHKRIARKYKISSNNLGTGKTFLSNSQEPQAVEKKIHQFDGSKGNKQNQNTDCKVGGNIPM